MALSHGPSIVTRNLLLNLDFGNIQKCYNGSENLFTYSEEFNNGAWTSFFGQNAVVTSNQIEAPDGTLSADLITFTPDGTGQSRKEQNFGTRTGDYTVSAFVKKGTLSSIVLYISTGFDPYPKIIYYFDTDVIAGNGGATASRILYPNGWVRIIGTATIPNDNLRPGFLSSSSGTMYAWGAQVERGKVPSPYIKTVASSITRPTTATSTVSDYTHTVNNPQYISYDGENNSIRFDRNENIASFTGSITGSQLTVTAMSGITTIVNGAALSYTGLTPTRVITSFGTGIGTTGTYTVSGTGDASSRAMTAALKIGGSVDVTASGSLASSTYLYNDHTTEVWAKINDRDPSNYDSREGYSNLFAYQGNHSMFYYNASILEYEIWTSPTTTANFNLSLGTSGTDIIQGQWFQVVVTKSGTTYKTYVNGVLKKTNTVIQGAAPSISNRICLGSLFNGNSTSYSYYAKNNIGCAKMYNTALTEDEIRQNFNALRGRFGL